MRFFGERKPAFSVPPALATAVVFVVSLAIYGYLQWSRTFMDPDSFYHAKMAALMLERGIIKDFPWLPFTTLSTAFADHHFVYHILLLPFVAALGPLVGTKAAAAVFAAGAIATFHVLLRVHAVRYPAVFAMLMATSSSFLFRLNLAKTSSLSLIVLFLALIVIRKDKPILLFVLSWLYVLLYGGWPIMAVVVAVFLCARAVIDRLVDKHPFHSWFGRWFWRRLFRGSRHALRDFFSSKEVRHAVAAASGLLLGLIVNPYFPANLRFYWEQIVQIAVVNYQGQIGVGSEWYPYPFGELFVENSVVFIVMFLCFALLVAMVFWEDLVRRDGPVSRAEVTAQFASLFLASFFFIMTLRSRRHIEYFVPFAMFSISLFFTLLLSRLDLKAFRSRLQWLFPWPRVVVPALALYVVFLLVSLGARDVIANKDLYDRGIPWTKYANAAAWLREHAPKNAIILHSDWDDFPVLFFHDHERRYICGLDPTFMFRADPARYRLWADITTGKKTEGVAGAVRDVFGSQYLLIENDHDAMRKVIDADQAFRRVYQDDDAGIYVLK